jgi:murein DD-endopeptidase MepM/ murein hydrolase activator NlpD
MKRVVVLILLGLALLIYPLLLFFRSTTPKAAFAPTPPTALGNETPLKIRVDNPHGVRRVTARIEQGGHTATVFENTAPARRWSLLRSAEPAQEIAFSAGKKQAPALKEGKAKLLVDVVSNDLRASTTTLAQDVEIVTRPLTVAADGHQHYINQGGSELVTFTVDGYWTEAGVRVGKYTFRSFPMPGDPKTRFSIFGYPWDVPPTTEPVVYARNPTGAEATAKFWHKIFPKPARKRDLPLDDKFLTKVTNEIDPGGTGDLVTRFLRINGQMRKENNQKLTDLREQTAQSVLWKGPFVQLGNSKVESQFADQRSYLYNGKKIDEQVHLGFDLSVTQAVPVAASNDGKVLLAERLGIYGNCVVVDHGYGLQSIYGHLSAIDVKPGDMVKKGQTLGRSGATGLAGGDHLHFSMQVDGVQINPVEWWDEHWIKDRILSKLPQSGDAKMTSSAKSGV